MGAERVVVSVLLALRCAPGACLQVGLRDVADDLRAPIDHGLTSPGGRLGGGDPAYGVYRARDGWIAVAALEPHFRRRLYDALALPLDAPLDDPMAARTSGRVDGLRPRTRSADERRPYRSRAPCTGQGPDHRSDRAREGTGLREGTSLTLAPSPQSPAPRS